MRTRIIIAAFAALLAGPAAAQFYPAQPTDTDISGDTDISKIQGDIRVTIGDSTADESSAGTIYDDAPIRGDTTVTIIQMDQIRRAMSDDIRLNQPAGSIGAPKPR